MNQYGDKPDGRPDSSGAGRPAVPLSFMKEGEKGSVARISGKEEIRKHLSGLGFVPGAQVGIVSNSSAGLIIDVKGSRMAMDSAMASRIMLVQRGSGMTTLKDVPVGSTVTVRKISGDGILKRHIMDMGITKGSRITVRKVAPLGDPVEFTIRGYELSLRKMYAEMIEVERSGFRILLQCNCQEEDKDGLYCCACRKSQLRQNDSFQRSYRLFPARRELARGYYR